MKDTVVVAYSGGLAAYDDENGDQLWKQDGPNDRLCALGDLVVAVDCTNRKKDEKRLMIARRASDGAEAWQVELYHDREPADLTLVGEHVMVRMDKSKTKYTKLVARDGTVVLDLKEFVHHAVPRDGGWLVSTSSRLALLDEKGEAKWEVANDHADWYPFDSRRMTLVGEDIYLWYWGPISDSGVEVRRVSAKTGEAAWTAKCDPVGVSHSKYHHLAYIERRGDRLIVVSQGSYGWFIEVLNTADGKQVHRWKSGE
jgi:outer membrane protein assembly factor BamB